MKLQTSPSRNNMIKNLKKNWFPILVILFFISLPFYRHYMLKQRKSCYKITVGKVIGYEHSGRVSWGIKYEFKVKEKTTINYYEYKHTKLPFGTKVPVLYSCSDPDFSQLLLLPEDFKEYDLPYPDSLMWLEKYIKKHKEKQLWEY